MKDIFKLKFHFIMIMLCSCFLVTGAQASPFSTASNFGTAVHYCALIMGDIDNDGDAELIVGGRDASSVSRLQVYDNSGDGFFTGPTDFGTPLYECYMELADLNSDGWLDLVILGDTGSRVLYRYMNNGDGTFAAPVSIGTGLDWGSISIGDLDGDGDLDIVVTGDDGSPRLRRYMNNGDGTFGSAINFGTGLRYSSSALGDLDNDGDLDLVTAGNDASTAQQQKYTNNGNGEFGAAQSFGTGLRYCNIALGDINGDGYLDLIAAGYNSGATHQLIRYINDGTGNFSGTSFGTGMAYCSIAIGDLNNDGDLDVDMAGYIPGTMAHYSYDNDGTGVLSGPTSVGTGLQCCSIAFADFDNDLDLDVVTSGANGVAPASRMDRYRNYEAVVNNKPVTPVPLAATNINGKWRFRWNATTDLITPQKMLRYHVAFGTEPGKYNTSSTNIIRQRGQANPGNVPTSGTNWLQTKITNYQTLYWKVCAIDTALIPSDYCAEQRTPAPVPANPNNARSVYTNFTEIEVLWDDNSIDEWGFKIFRSVSNNTSFAYLTSLSSNVSCFTDKNLIHGTAYYYYIIATNDVGWYLTSNTNLTHTARDIYPPVIGNLIQPTNNTLTNVNTSSFSWYQAVDNELGMTNYIFSMTNTDSGWSTNIVLLQTNVMLLTIPDGTNHWHVRAQDKAWNIASTVTDIIIIDTIIPPAPQLVSPTNNALTNNNTPLLIWKTPADATGIKSYDVWLDTSTNQSLTTNYTPVTGLTDGPHTWQVRAIDKANNIGNWAVTWNLLIDTNLPSQCTLVQPLSNKITNTAMPVLTWNSAFDSGGVAYYEIEVDGTTNQSAVTNYTPGTSLSQGTNYWRVRAVDNYNNFGPWSMVRSIIIDTNAPAVVSLIKPVNNKLTNNIIISFLWYQAADAVTGVSNYHFKITNKVYTWVTNIYLTQTNITLNSLQAGTNFWKVRAMDRALNWNQWSSTNHVNIDLLAPGAANPLSPTNFFITNNSSIQFTWHSTNDNFSGISNYQFFITNKTSLWRTNIHTPQTNVLLSIMEGTNYWTVRAYDRANNIGTWSISNRTILDTIDPAAVSLLVPASNVIYTNKSGGIFYEWNTSSDTGTGLSSYRLVVTNTNLGWSTNIITLNTNINLPNIIEGAYKWYVIDYDKAQNYNYSLNSWFTVDTNKPSAVIPCLPPDNSMLYGSNIVFSWSHSVDSITSVTNYQVFITNESIALYTNFLTINTNEILNLADGLTYWRVNAVDKAGHWSWPGPTSMVLIDSTSPAPVTLFMPVNGKLTNNSSVSFQWSPSSDILSGLTNYQLTITNQYTGWSTNYFTAQTNILVNNIAEGTNTCFVRAMDKAGNYSLSINSNSLRIDLTPSVLSRITPLSNDKSGVTVVQFQWIVTDANGVSNQVFRLDTDNNIGNGFEVIISTNNLYTYDFPGNGTNNWQIWTMDMAGNTNLSTIWPVIIETNAIIIDLYQPAWVNINTASPEFLWSDASDVGAVSNIIQISLNSNFTLIQRTNSGGGNFTNWIVTPALSTSKYYWRILTYKESTVTWFTSAVTWVTIDTNTPSQVSLYDPLNLIASNGNNINFTWSSASDIGVGITNYALCVTNTNTMWMTNIILAGTNISLSHDQHGFYNWFVRSFDKVGNMNTSVTENYRIDKLPPSAPVLLQPGNLFLTNNKSFTLLWRSVLDDNSNVSNYQVHVTNNNNWGTNMTTLQTNILLLNSAEGTNWWKVRAMDAVNRQGAWSSSNRFIIDSTPPAVSLVSPASNEVVVYLSVPFQWNASDYYGITNQRIDIDTDNNTGNGFEIQIMTNSPYTNIFAGNSTNNWRVRVMDRSGNTNYSSVWPVIIKTNTPRAALYYPVDRMTNKDTVLFSWSDETSLGCASNVIQVSGSSNFGSIARQASGNGIFTNWTVTPVLTTDKWYWRVLTFRLSTSTWFTSAFSWVDVDLLGPQVAILNFTNFIDAKNSVSLKAYISDLSRGNHIISNAGYGFDSFNNATNQALTVYSNASAGWYGTNIPVADLLSMPQGPHRVFVRGKDSLNNWTEQGAALSNSFTLDKIAFFKIQHAANQIINTWADIVIRAHDVQTNLIPDYTATVQLDTTGTPAGITWQNLSGSGVLTPTGGDTATYQFSLLDNGVVTLAIRNATAETMNISVRVLNSGGWHYDDDTEGVLNFEANPLLNLSDLVYAFTNSYVSATNIRAVMSGYGGADYYLLEETGVQPATNNPNWHNLGAGTTISNYAIINNAVDGWKTVYLWIKVSSIGWVNSILCSNRVFLDRTGPPVSAGPLAAPLSAGSIRVYRPAVPADAGVGSDRWVVERTNGSVILGTNNIAVASILDSGLTANRDYGYRVYFLDRFNNMGTWSSISNKYTWAAAPDINSQFMVNNFYTNTNFAFTNKNSLGDGGINYFRYAWNTSLTYTVSGGDALWAPAGVDDIMTNYVTTEANWYLHIRSYNNDDLGGSQVRIGSFRYFLEVPGPPFAISATKTRILPTGEDYTVITSDPIYNLYDSQPITDGHSFNIDGGKHDLIITDEDPALSGIQVKTKQGRIRFEVRSRQIGRVDLKVTSAVNTGVSDSILLDFVPDVERVPIVNNTIIKPGLGDQVRIYIYGLKCQWVKIYDIKGNLVKEWQENELTDVSDLIWDCRINGRICTAGMYFIAVESDLGRKVLRIVILK